MDAPYPPPPPPPAIYGTHLPNDRGMGGLGLIMQLGGGLFAAMTAMMGFTQILVLSKMRSYGAPSQDGIVLGMLVLTVAGVVRALLHRAAGVELLYGNDPAGAIRRYVVAAGVHVALWVGFLVIKFDAPLAGWLPVALLFAAWPAALVILLAQPSLHLDPGAYGTSTVPRAEDHGFEGLAILMVILGLCGTLFGALMLMVFLDMPGGGKGGLFQLFLLTLAALVVRSAIHLHAGATALSDPTPERVEVGANRYASFGTASGLAVAGVLMLVIMSEPGSGFAAMPMIIGVAMMLMVWPMAVKRLVQTRRLEQVVDDKVGFARAPDQGRTAIGWLVLALGVMALASALPAALLSPDAAGDGRGNQFTQMVAFQQGDPTRGPWLQLGVAVLQVWAGVELVMMTERHRWVATAYGVAATLVALYVTWPMISHLDNLGRGAGINPMGNALFAGLAMTLVIPIATLALVHRKLPPPSPTSGIAAVFD
ncbi:MAG: hypothetical protein H6709_21890 [Kofleriaceae bacterium]|nr:hypothetical protein [Myxococcales bacterium]MCB9574737.1 hypothetical protein [Kofleriaceae bacterium]